MKDSTNVNMQEGKAITLGIDIGLSSIGWALVEDKKKFIDGGVHIFINGGEDKANATRRQKRLERRQTRRRSMRIRRLIHELKDTSMLPINTTENLRKQLDQAARLTSKERHATTSSDDSALKEQAQVLKDFFDLNPWALRKKAIEGEKLTPLALGRVFYHFAHQRGFPKRSLRTLEGDKKAEDEAKTLKEGNPKDDKIGAEATQEAIKKQAKYPYLGYYLATLVPNKGTAPYEMVERIRSRYTYREMYEAEFDHIWKTQSHHHPELLTPQRKAAIKHILFFQLPLQTPPRGRCTFEPSKKRAYLASLPFEEFRAYQYVNNFLAQYGLKTAAARMPLLEKAIAEFLGRKTGIAPTQLAKKLQLSKTKKAASTEETQDKEPKRAEFQFTTQLRTLFGPATWDGYTEAEKNERWLIIFRSINQLKDIDSLKKYAKKHWHFKDKQIADLGKVITPKGVGSISEKAIRYILPYLKKGYRYDQAVLLGSIRKAFGHNFDKEALATNYWTTLSQAEKEAIETQVLTYLGETNEKARDQIIDYLKENYPKKALYTAKIYHHSNFALPERHKKLPLPTPTRNPIVDKALIQLRRVVNAVMKKHELTDIPRIRVEMARELKNSPKARQKTEDTIKQHTREREEAYQNLQKSGRYTTPYNIKKYRLWKEANYTCPFSGTKISLQELYDGKDGDPVEIEHIRPIEPKDNRWLNLTIALRSINQEKDNKTPYKAFFSQKPPGWEAIKARVKACFSPKKYDHFISEEPLEKQLITQRELGLTGYITRETKNYLRHISPKVESPQGGIVSTLRREWKLNQLLSRSFVCKQADSTLEFKGKQIAEGSTCYVTYREASSEGEVPSPSEGWRSLSEETVLPQYELIDIAPFEPTFKGRDTEEINKDIKKCLLEFKKLKTLTDKAEKDAQEKVLKRRLKGYHDENRDQEKHNNSTKKALIATLKKHTKATLGHANFYIIEARLQKKRHDLSSKETIHTFYLNPIESKNRSDHRHHLIDACVIATTEIKHTQRINKAAGEDKHSQERKYNTAFPWRGFSEDTKERLSKTLISIDQPLKICAKAKKFVKIPRYDQGTQGKRYRKITAQGLTAQGQLCKETIYGQYTDKDGKKKYHVRKPITAIQTLKKADKIVDKPIRELVKAHIEKYGENKVPFFEEKKEGNKIIGRVPLLYLPKKGDKTATASPIKSVRIAENSECMKPAKSKASNNSWVNPRNNAIAGFYYHKDHIKNPWTVGIVTFWDAVQQVSKKKKPLPARNAAGGSLCFTLKINDFVLFLPEALQSNSIPDLELLVDTEQLSPYLYRVQKLSQDGRFSFRKHTAATLESPLEQLELVCSSLLNRNPIKVAINKLGKITKWKILNPKPS